MIRRIGFSLVLTVALIETGCTASPSVAGRVPSDAGLIPSVRTSGENAVGKYIQHVVIIVQENRSFENIFAGFPGADAPTYGYTHLGVPVPLRPITFAGRDIGHYYAMAIKEWDHGAMDGFDLNQFASSSGSGGSSSSAGTYPYAYLQRSLVVPYWSMAREYVLADRMFPTEFGPSFTAHLDLIAGTDNLSRTEAEVDTPSAEPWGCDAPGGTTTDVLTSQLQWETNGPPPCFTSKQFNTMADVLDAAKVSWKYYAPVADAGGDLWSSFDAIENVRYGADWKKVVSPETTVLTDIKNGALPAVSWVTPDVANSDHPGNGSDTGPSWVASVVNAVGSSKFWKSTAIVVLWDDWGGWYDDAPPPQLDFLGLGIRVPCIIISPYAKRHAVSHTQYEFGSVLKFVEQVFNLASLGYTDARANSLLDSFDFTQTPRSFARISAPYSASHFLHEKPSLKPPDND